MLRQMKLLTALECRNLCGLNVYRHTRDKQLKRKFWLMACLWTLLIGMLMVYVGALAWGLIFLRLSRIVPAYLMMIASLLVLAFGLFKAGDMIFRPKGYEMLCALPLSTASIVASRFLRMYMADLGLCALVMLPGCAVYGWMLRPGAIFWLGGFVSTLLMPMLPLAVSTLLGTAVAAAAARMKHKMLAQTVLSLVMVVVVLGASLGLAAIPEESWSVAMLFSLADTIGQLIGRIYPPAAWMGNAMTDGRLGVIALYTVGNLMLFAALIAAVTRCFHPVSRRLFARSARHDYRLQALEQHGLMKALWRREVRRYFASSVYVTNTIVGPIMGVMLSAALLIFGTDLLQTNIPLPLDVRGLIPFALGMVFTMMPTTPVSISMEGSSVWLAQTLPIRRKQYLDAKILLNLSVMLPFWMISELLLMIALKPSVMEALWLIAIPALLSLFAAVAGIAANLRLPRFDWDSEVVVVKQSASASIGVFAGMLVSLLCAAPAVMFPGNVTKALVCAALAAVTYFLYRHNNKTA